MSSATETEKLCIGKTNKGKPCEHKPLPGWVECAQHISEEEKKKPANHCKHSVTKKAVPGSDEVKFVCGKMVNKGTERCVQHTGKGGGKGAPCPATSGKGKDVRPCAGFAPANGSSIYCRWHSEQMAMAEMKKQLAALKLNTPVSAT